MPRIITKAVVILVNMIAVPISDISHTILDALTTLKIGRGPARTIELPFRKLNSISRMKVGVCFPLGTHLLAGNCYGAIRHRIPVAGHLRLQ
jgi:hypothetical protein